jgi:outer membrane protein assembly factor BamD
VKKAYFCVLMNKSFIFLIACSVFFTACKSEFEKIRASNDPKLHYEKAMEFYEAGSYQKAQTLFELVISSYKGRKEAEDIYFKYAYTFFYLERYILASYYFNNFSQTYGGSDFREEADFMSAYAQYKMSPIFRLDQSNTKKAIDEMQLYVNTYPLSPRVEECNRLIDEMRAKLEEKAYSEGILYFNLRQYQSSVQVLENLLKDFPETNRADKIRYDIIKSMYLWAENSIITKQEERYTKVVENGEEFLVKYPNSPYFNEVRLIVVNSNKIIKSVSNVGYQN